MRARAWDCVHGISGISGISGSWTGRKGYEGIVHRRCRHDIWLRTQLPGMSFALPKVKFSPSMIIVSCMCVLS